MVATLPTTGRATWTDRVDNWRVLDTDWVQDRLILRYAAGATTMGEGTVYYDTTEKCLMVRNSSTSIAVIDHACIAAAANLRVYPGASDTTVTLGHKTTPGNGLVITSTGKLIIKPSLATVNDTVLIDATGIALHTGAMTAKLTSDSVGLACDKPITASQFNGNVIATASTDAKALTATSGNFGSNVSITGTLGVTGATTLGTATVTTLNVSPIGATLNFGSRLGQHINLFATTYGIGIQGSTLYYRSASQHHFYVGGTHTDTAGTAILHIDSGSVDVAANFTVTGSTVSTGTFYGYAKGRFGGDGAQIQLIDSVTGTGTENCYMEFYGNGTLSAPGSRYGYLGYPGSGVLQIINEATNGGVSIGADGTGVIHLGTGTGGSISLDAGTNGHIHIDTSGVGVIEFTSGGVERGRIVNDHFLWGKSATNTAATGVEIIEAGGIYATTTSAIAPNLYLRHIGSADANTVPFIEFRNGAGTLLSEFTQDAVAPIGTAISNCVATAPSDYRWKDDLGPVTGALDRVMQLQPKRFQWKGTDKLAEGFIAHEAEPVVPYLVRGEKDAVTDTGEIDGQGLNYAGLTPLLAAAIQELAGRVKALESAA